MNAPSNANTSGLAEIISDDEILRVHGHANFGSDMTPRDVVNEGVLKYAFGYCSGHTQLCILMEHGLITKPRPGRYDASLTKKGKRYARALGGYQNAVTAAPASPLPGGGWQDISTAPKDGTKVLGWSEGDFTVVEWSSGGYWTLSECGAYASDGEWWPAHWMPLPAAPTGDAT